MQYLPLGLPPRAYTSPRSYGDVTGGKVWEAAREFRAVGVPADLVESLEQWGIAFSDRAARIQYH